jgi:hypoxanthine phosphoribosyltransferase
LLSVTVTVSHEPADFDKTQKGRLVMDRMSVPTPKPWKGLAADRLPVFLGYDQTERMIAALLDRAAQWQPDAVVGIARGGLVPATMAAGILALPLTMIGFERAAGSAAWIGAPPSSGRVLLVDDGCSTGRTMAVVREALLREGRDCLTLAVVHDPDVTAFIPDLSHAMRVLWRFPWERGEATPAGRALRATGAGPDRTTELPFYGLDLDGVFLPDVPDAVYLADIDDAVARRHALEPFASLPYFAPERAVVITGRPESDRARTCAWLARWGHGALPLECRPSDMPHDPDRVARYKAEAATRWGCTHFVESDAEQALRIAAHAPHLVVSWWSARDARAWLIGVAAQPESAARP